MIVFDKKRQSELDPRIEKITDPRIEKITDLKFEKIYENKEDQQNEANKVIPLKKRHKTSSFVAYDDPNLTTKNCADLLRI